MTWLSLVTVEKEDWAGLDSYKRHQAIWQVFPRQDGRRRSFLYRVDDREREFRVYLLSPVRPTLPTWGKWQTKEITETFLDHDRYRFQLKVNPTMRRKEDGRRLGLFKEDLLRTWMSRKAETHGFEVLEGSLSVGAPIEERFYRDGTLGKHMGVDFQGVLKVTDREKFKRAFVEGIGSAKAFGFGLLMLQPV
jgi:CRISPR system Cascade subunit CasE